MKRTYLLAGIPDLNMDAFSPVAGRMKLYCGGGGGGGDNGAAQRALQEAQRQMRENEQRIAELKAQAAAEEAAVAKASADAEYAAQSNKNLVAAAAGKNSLRLDTGAGAPLTPQRGRFGLSSPGGTNGNGLGV